METKEFKDKFSPIKLMIPIVIGIGVVGYMFFKEFDLDSLELITWGGNTFFGLIGILLLVGVRLYGYMLRLRILTDNELSWKKCFDVIVLWNFASAISPSAVGGTSVAIFLLNKEKISLGRSGALSMITLILDLVFFVFISLVFYFVLGGERFFGARNICGDQLNIQSIFGGYQIFFFSVISGICLYLFLLFYSVFVNVNLIKGLVGVVFKLPVINRFRSKALNVVDELGKSAHLLKQKSYRYWFNLFLATGIAWTARFLLVNPVINVLVHLDFMQHIVLYARNFVLWMVMIVPSTPGASGVSEVALSGLICEFLPSDSLNPIVILIWRFFDYFFYLILGMIVLPRWVARTFRK